MDYEKKYNELVEAVRELQEANPSDEGIKNWVNDNVPELAESEDEKIRRNIIAALKGEGYYDCDLTNECIAWLEKQGGTKDKLNTMLDDSLSRETKETWNKFLDEQKPVKIDEGRAKMMFILALEKVEERTNKGYKLTDNDKNSWWNDFKTYALSGNKGEQNHTNELDEQNLAWSKEDEQNLNAALSYINDEYLRRWLKDAIYNKYE